MQNYRIIPFYANSDLGEFRKYIFGIEEKAHTSAMEFGTAFHSWVLEGIVPEGLTTPRLKQASTMREAVLKNTFFRQTLQSATPEVVQLWVDQQTGLPCKSKMDLLSTDFSLIVDLKTTSCRNYHEFIDSCSEPVYSYDRQAAFYLSGIPGAERFVFLGVQKQAPFSVFFYEATAHSHFIKAGQKKYKRLLNNIKQTGFTPSSWAAAEPVNPSLSLPFLLEAA